MAPKEEAAKRNAETGRGEAAPVWQAFPWERQPGETAEAYRAFVLYRSQDPRTRSFRALAPLCSHTLAVRWAKRWRWVTRTVEHEAWSTANQAELSETGRLHLRVRSVRLSSALMNAAEQSAAKLSETKPDASDVVALAEAGVRLGRVALDMPPDGPVARADSGSTGLSVSFGSAVPWLAAFAPAKQNETQPNGSERNEVVLSGEQVLDATPPIAGRKRLVTQVRDCQPDNVLSVDSAARESERAKPVQIPPGKTIEIAPPDPEKPYRRCRKHGNSCRRGGHN